jgi:hypothetical protein
MQVWPVKQLFLTIGQMLKDDALSIDDEERLLKVGQIITA